jgi:ATP/maltotriose-dependent transcriptional regulator MalT
MTVARMKRLSTPVELAMSRIDSWIAEISSALLRATDQESQDSSIVCLFTVNLDRC